MLNVLVSGNHILMQNSFKEVVQRFLDFGQLTAGICVTYRTNRKQFFFRASKFILKKKRKLKVKVSLNFYAVFRVASLEDHPVSRRVMSSEPPAAPSAIVDFSRINIAEIHGERSRQNMVGRRADGRRSSGWGTDFVDFCVYSSDASPLFLSPTHMAADRQIMFFLL